MALVGYFSQGRGRVLLREHWRFLMHSLVSYRDPDTTGVSSDMTSRALRDSSIVCFITSTCYSNKAYQRSVFGRPKIRLELAHSQRVPWIKWCLCGTSHRKGNGLAWEIQKIIDAFFDRSLASLGHKVSFQLSLVNKCFLVLAEKNRFTCTHLDFREFSNLFVF